MERWEEICEKKYGKKYCEAFREEFREAFRKGYEETRASSIYILMMNINKTFEECAELIEVPKNEWEYYRVLMNELFPPPSVGDILREKFMEPLGISIERLENDIHVMSGRIDNIIQNKGRITCDLSLRLGKYFDVSDRYFMDLQTGIDIRFHRFNMEEILKTIPTIDWHALQKEDDDNS